MNACILTQTEREVVVRSDGMTALVSQESCLSRCQYVIPLEHMATTVILTALV